MSEKLISFLILLIAIPMFVILGLLLILCTFILPFYRFKAAWLASVGILTSMGVFVKVHGKFPDSGHYIVMANHSSFIDPVLLPRFMQGKYTGIAADYNFKYPIWAQMLRRFNVIEINRSDHEKAVLSIKHAEDVIKNEGYHVAILPEGTRTLTGKMGPLKKGGFHMAVNSAVPILPVGIQGAYNFKPKYRRSFRPGLINISIGEPISAEEYPELGVYGLLEKVEKKLKELSGEI